MEHVKEMVIAAIKIFMELKWSVKILLFLVVVGLFTFISIEITGQPAFCNSCHIMNPYYDSWKASSHSDVSCLKCHLKPGLANYAVGKIRGLSQSIDCMVG